jgi:hypothetical protein
MARRIKFGVDPRRIKVLLGRRFRELRHEYESAGGTLDARLGVPLRSWYNFEWGGSMPADVLLRLIELTSVEPMWLLHGTGPKYRVEASSPADPRAAAADMIRATLELL